MSAPVGSLRSRHDGDGDPATAEAPATPRGRGAGDHWRAVLGTPARGAPTGESASAFPGQGPQGAGSAARTRVEPPVRRGGKKERVATWVCVHSPGPPS